MSRFIIRHRSETPTPLRRGRRVSSAVVCTAALLLAGCDNVARHLTLPAPSNTRDGTVSEQNVDPDDDVMVAWRGATRDANGTYERPSPRTPAPAQLQQSELDTIQLFADASRSVVHITTHAVRRDLLTRNDREVPSGMGTGILWDELGHVVTSYHVIQDAHGAQIAFHDQSAWPAELIGVSPDSDLAVLRVNAPRERLRPIPLGTSHDLQVGQRALAIGNPFGLDYTLTTGIISALGRQLPAGNGRILENMIQSDTAINPGNSGGPLLDSSGRMIGITSAIYSPSGAYAGIGFAIPADTVAWVVPELIANGKIVRPTLGVGIAPGGWSGRFGVEGVLILRVTPGSGAERAGLRAAERDDDGNIDPGDVIVGIDDEPIRSPNDLLSALQRRQPGDVVALTINRGGDRIRVDVELRAPA